MGRADEDEQMHSNMCIRVKERTTEEQGGELKCKGQHWPKNKLISLQWKLKKVAKLQNHCECGAMYQQLPFWEGLKKLIYY